MNLRIAFFIIVSSLLLVWGQNCTNARLAAKAIRALPSIVSGENPQTLPIPTRESGDARIVIVLDQSFSMVWDKCPQDLDGESPNPSG